MKAETLELADACCYSSMEIYVVVISEGCFIIEISFRDEPESC